MRWHWGTRWSACVRVTGGFLGLALALWFGTGCCRLDVRMTAQEDKVYRLDVGPAGIVELCTAHGSIEARSEPRADLLVKVHLRAQGVTQDEADQRLALSRVEGRTTALGAVVHVELASRGGREDLSGAIEALVPSGAALRLAATGGGVRVVDVRAPIDLEASGGSIHVRRVAGTVQVRTIDAEVVGEELALTGPDGMSQFEITRGRVQLDLSELEHPVQIEASGAPVGLILPATADCMLDLETADGVILIGLGDLIGTERVYGKRVRHRIGGGRVPIAVRSSKGDIIVRQRSAAEEGGTMGVETGHLPTRL